MKIPKTVKRLCPFCKKHTSHKVMQSKKSMPRSLSRGLKYRAKDRGLAKGKGNLGRYSKPAISKFKLTGSKQSKKADIRYECAECKKKHVKNKTKRAKRVEFK